MIGGERRKAADAAASGYLNAGYAWALREFGEPVELPACGAYLLRRAIPGTDRFDAMGLYPYLACADWSVLPRDLASLEGELVSFAATPDPFGSYTRDDLERAFPDHLVRFKDHFVADLSRPLDEIVSKHHRKESEKALRVVDVEFSETPVEHLDDWMALFAEAVRRFRLTGIRAFSRRSFEEQLSLPGVVMSLASAGGNVVAAHIQIHDGHVGYAHLAAALPEARALGATYALYFREIEHYAGRLAWLDWGGGAGVEDHRSGLTRFKRGWSTDTRPVYFGGRILDPEGYRVLRATMLEDPGTYFPAYRAGEFN
jgi:hypothetical protein